MSRCVDFRLVAIGRVGYPGKEQGTGGRAREGCRQVGAALEAEQRISRSTQLPSCSVSLDVPVNAVKARLAPEAVERCRARGTVTADGILLSKSHAPPAMAQEREDIVHGVHHLQ